LGYIAYNGKIEIHSSLLNVVLYDKPEIETNHARNAPEFLVAPGELGDAPDR